MLKWITVTIVLEELWLVIKYYTCYIISCSYFGGFYAVLGLAELIWSAAWVILNRIFVYHFLLGILIILFILIHILLPHNFSSSNPSINNNTLIISSYPFIFKDLYSSFITITIIISIFLYWEPDILGNSDNQIIANPLITPNNILPEWYYLLFHSCPRSFPNKTIGVILVLNIIIMIINRSFNSFNWMSAFLLDD